MVGFLRGLSLLNAGVWLGAAVFMFVVALTIFTDAGVDRLLGARPEKGLAGQIFFHRFYLLQYICAGTAALLLFLEWKIGKLAFPKWRFFTLLLISGLVLGGGLWLSPKLAGLLKEKYPSHFQPSAMATPQRGQLLENAKRAEAEHARWHRVSEGSYAATMLLLLIYFTATARQSAAKKPRKAPVKKEVTLASLR
tara:strand:+ start:249 stop:833 length:585 start_codon:yes stop_codon:yes gene_type:complete